MTIETTDREARSVSAAASDHENLSNVGSLLSQLGHDVGSLVSTEVHLAKAEIGQSMDDAKMA